MLLWGALFPLVKLGYRAFSLETSGDILLFAGLRFAVCGAVIGIGCLLRDRTRFIPLRNAGGACSPSGCSPSCCITPAPISA